MYQKILFHQLHFLEIIPPRLPTPPPFVIQQQDPSPPTPPPLILREVPPTPPPHQEVQIINKILPQEPPPSQRVIIEHNPPVDLISLFHFKSHHLSFSYHQNLNQLLLKNGYPINQLHLEK